MNLVGPEPVRETHDFAEFYSGEAMLDDWLRNRALANELHGAARTLVIADGVMVRGYFALAASSISLVETSGRFRRNMPDPAPVIILGRLALDRALQGRGWGAALFYDAASRVLATTDIVGIRGMVVHAISDDAKAFYLKMGMRASPLSPNTLMLTCADLRQAIGN